MNSRSHLAVGAVCLAAFCAIAFGAPEQAQAGAAADENQADAVVATVCGQQIFESDLRAADADLESPLTPSEIQAHRLRVLKWRIIDAFRQAFVVNTNAVPTDQEVDEAERYFRTVFKQASCGMTQCEVEQRLAALQSEAAEARAKQEERPELQEEIKQTQRLLDKSTVVVLVAAPIVSEEWSFQRALYRKYGGRACMNESGPEAIDAMRAWLKEAADRGDISFANDADRDVFWAQFPAPGDPIPSEIENAAQIFETIGAYLEARGPTR